MNKMNNPEYEIEDEMPSTIDFEYLLSNIMGKQRWHGFAGHHDLKTWKSAVEKLFESINKHITYNVEATDNLHKKELILESERALEDISEARVVHHVNEAAIIRLTNLVFLLMGNIPYNWEKKTLNRAKHYKLDEFRKVSYSQTNDQKINLFLLLMTERPYINKYKKSNYFIDYMKTLEFDNERLCIDWSKAALRRKYNDEYRGDSFKFLEWLKLEFNDIYKDILKDMTSL
jgi:hypothetical protein